MYTTTSKCPSPWRAAEKTQPGIRARVHHLWECLKCTNSAHATSQHSNMFHPWLALQVTTIRPTGLKEYRMQCRARSKTRLAGSPFGTRPLGMYTTTSKCPSPWRAAEKTQPGIRARVHHLWECLKCTNSAHATSQHNNMFHPWLALQVTTIIPAGLKEYRMQCRARSKTRLACSPFGTRPLRKYTTTSKCPSPWRAAERTQPGIRVSVHHL